MGRVDEGLAVGDSIMKGPPKSGRTWYNMACVLACAAAVDPERKDELADRSMKFLEDSLKNGFWDVDLMMTDKDLDFLHTREDYIKLVTAMRERMGKEKEAGPIQ